MPTPVNGTIRALERPRATEIQLQYKAAPVRRIGRVLRGVLTTTVALHGVIRATPVREKGATLPTTTSLTAKVRVSERASGRLGAFVPVAGKIRATEDRQKGAALALIIPIRGTIESTGARPRATSIQVQYKAAPIRSRQRVRNATVTSGTGGSSALAGVVRELPRVKSIVPTTYQSASEATGGVARLNGRLTFVTALHGTIRGRAARLPGALPVPLGSSVALAGVLRVAPERFSGRALSTTALRGTIRRSTVLKGATLGYRLLLAGTGREGVVRLRGASLGPAGAIIPLASRIRVAPIDLTGRIKTSTALAGKVRELARVRSLFVTQKPPLQGTAASGFARVYESDINPAVVTAVIDCFPVFAAVIDAAPDDLGGFVRYIDLDIALVPKDGDWYVRVSQVTDAKTGLAIIDATVIANVQTLGGAAVTGAQSLAAAYDATTSAYWALVPRAASLARGQEYRAQVLITKGGLQVPFYQKVKVVRFLA